MNTTGLDRKTAVPALIGEHRDFLIVAGLAGAARDLAALTGDAEHLYTMAGAMGGATMIGMGLALARPGRPVLVVTGDGELLMNLGALATVAVHDPPNLSIVCVDNGRYGETGYQRSHTALGVDLRAVAEGAGIASTRVVTHEAQMTEARAMLRDGSGTSFVVLKVLPTQPPVYRRLLDPAACRLRFRAALLGRS